MMDQKVKFNSTLLLVGKTATGVQVPNEIVEKIGAGKRPAVKVTINGYTYPNTIAVMNGVFMLAVNATVREKAGIKSGDLIEVELDTLPREVALPEDFKMALEENPTAKKNFEMLSNSNKKRFILPIEQAKTVETKNRRIEKAISELKQGNKI
jgi:hypothetical protein